MLLLTVLLGCAPHRPPDASSMTGYALRLQPGDDLKDSLLAWREAHQLDAAAVVTCVGSLSAASVRFADQPEATSLIGPFEIVSLTGTLSPDGAHLHVALSDATGRTIGGHLASGSTVYTTAELVLVALPELRFSRARDAVTTWPELVITPVP